MRIIAVLVLFALFALLKADHFNVDGVWTIDANSSLSLCTDPSNTNRVHGIWSEAYSFQARRDEDASTDTVGVFKGRYYGVGWKLTAGKRTSRRNYLVETGKLMLSYSSETQQLTVKLWYRKSNNTMTATLTRASTTVTDTVNSCGIIDTNSNNTMTMTGVYSANGVTFDALTANNRKGKANKRVTATTTSADGIFYNIGVCYKGGKICTFDYYQNNGNSSMVFGAGLGVLTSDNSVLAHLWLGLPASYSFSDFVNNANWHFTFMLPRTSDSASNPEQGASQLFNALKCRSLDQETCERMEFLGSCRAEEGQYDEDFFVCATRGN